MKKIILAFSISTVVTLGLAGMFIFYLCSLLLYDIPLLAWFKLKNSYKMFWVPMPEIIRDLIPVFDSHGLRHNLDYLDSIKREIPYWGIYRQAEFADLSTIRDLKRMGTSKNRNFLLSDTNRFLTELLESNKPAELIFQMNATTFGNLAYISIKAGDMGLSLKIQEAIQLVRGYYDSFKTK